MQGQRLKEDLSKVTVRSERRIYIEFPSSTDHVHHLMGEVRQWTIERKKDLNVIFVLEKIMLHPKVNN